MAISSSCIWSVLSGGDSAAGGGFVTGAGSKATDLAATSATGNSPVVTSASYTFVANDVNHWLYVAAGANWTPGFYKIASVNAGAATLSAAIGAASVYDSTTNTYIPNTVAGCATVASPTGGTWAINYSLKTTAGFTFTDLVIDGATNTDATSVANPITVAMIGNVLNVTSGTGFTVQRVSLNSIPSGVIGRFDKSLGTLGSTGGNGKMGAAFDQARAGVAVNADANVGADGQQLWIGAGTYTSATNINLGKEWIVRGYNTVPGDIDPDTDALTNAPVWRVSAGVTPISLSTASQPCCIYNIIFDGNSVASSSGPLINGASSGSRFKNCKFMAFDGTPFTQSAGGNPVFERCEFAAHDTTITIDSLVAFYNCYFHDFSTHAVTFSGTYGLFQGCIFDTITGDAIRVTNASQEYFLVENCTFYSCSAYGINFNSASVNPRARVIRNSIFESCATAAIRSADATSVRSNIHSVGNFFRSNGANHDTIGFIEKVTALSATPFVDAAGGDFTLNTTAGLAIAGSGWPATVPGTATEVNPSPGASQGRTANRGDALGGGVGGGGFKLGGYNGNVIGG